MCRPLYLISHMHRAQGPHRYPRTDTSALIVIVFSPDVYIGNWDGLGTGEVQRRTSSFLKVVAWDDTQGAATWSDGEQPGLRLVLVLICSARACTLPLATYSTPCPSEQLAACARLRASTQPSHSLASRTQGARQAAATPAAATRAQAPPPPTPQPRVPLGPLPSPRRLPPPRTLRPPPPHSARAPPRTLLRLPHPVGPRAALAAGPQGRRAPPRIRARAAMRALAHHLTLDRWRRRQQQQQQQAWQRGRGPGPARRVAEVAGALQRS